MKHRSILSLLLASVISAGAVKPEFQPDTVADIKLPILVTITEEDSTTIVEVNGTRSNPEYRLRYSLKPDPAEKESITEIAFPFSDYSSSRPKKSGKSQWRSGITFFSNIYCGATIPYSAPEAVRTSVDYGIGSVIGKRFRKGTSSIGIGIGLARKEYRIRRGHTAQCIDDCLILMPAPEGASNTSTSLSTFALKIPLSYTQRFYRSLTFKLSAELSYNLIVRGSTSYDIGNTHCRSKISGLHQRLITPAFTFALGTSSFGGLYVRWEPVSLFKSTYGPRLTTYSIGFTLGI